MADRVDERPVAGACERCGRAAAPLIPEPGSGDLKLERASEALRWCPDCGDLVGRHCCWGDGGVPTCARCAEAHAADASGLGGFAALGMARAAVRQLDGLAPEFSSAEETLERGNGFDTDGALRAWQTAWLAMARLRLQIDASRDAATWWLRRVPLDDADRAAELAAELDELTAAATLRWGTLADRLADGGRRLAAMRDWRPKRARPSPVARSAQPAPARTEPAPAPKPAPALPVSVALPVRAPERVSVAVRTSVVATPAPIPAAPRPPAAAVASRSATGVPASRPEARAVPVPPPAAQRIAPVPRTTPAAVAAPHVQPHAEPRAEPRVGMRDEPRRASMGGIVLAAIGLGLAVALVVGTASMLSGLATDGPTPPPPAADASVRAEPSEPPRTSPTSTDGVPGSALIVDAHPVGALDPAELPNIRVTGSPEVVALPSAFDRSIRLAGDSGLCMRLSSPSPDAVPTVSLDLQAGGLGSGGRLSFGLPAAGEHEAIGLQLDVAALAGLDRALWYRVTVRADGDAGHLSVVPTDGGPAVLDIALAPDPAAAPAAADETCMHASLGSAGGSLLVDRVRGEP
jgi:hypothetical protein